MACLTINQSINQWGEVEQGEARVLEDEGVCNHNTMCELMLSLCGV